MARVRDSGCSASPTSPGVRSGHHPRRPPVGRRRPPGRCCSACRPASRRPATSQPHRGPWPRRPQPRRPAARSSPGSSVPSRWPAAPRFVALLDVPDRLLGGARSPPGGRTSTPATPRPTTRGSAVPARRPAAPPSPCRRRRSPPASSPTARLRLGLPWGPANELAHDAVRSEAAESPTPSTTGCTELGINVFRAERDGFRLTAARTLSSDPDYRQLSVRRLMTMLAAQPRAPDPVAGLRAQHRRAPGAALAA